MLACWVMWTSHIYGLPDEFWHLLPHILPLSSFAYFLLLPPHVGTIQYQTQCGFLFSLSICPSPPPPSSACASTLLLWRAHHQELPCHSPRRPAQRPPRGRTHRGPVPGCHVYTSQTGHSHSHQQPSADSAHPKCLNCLSRFLDKPFYETLHNFTPKPSAFLFVKDKTLPLLG